MYPSKWLWFVFISNNICIIFTIDDFGFDNIGSHFGYGNDYFGKFGPDFSHGLIGPKYSGATDLLQKSYGEGKKIHDDQQFFKGFGKEGGDLNRGTIGFTKGADVFKNVKGDSGYLYGSDGNKDFHYSQGDSSGTKHFGTEGKSGGEKANKEGHKKGHVIKGYSTSHHKDENGKTEEFYDEDHNEGTNLGFDGRSGKFGENTDSVVKVGHQDGKYSSGDSKKGTHYENESINDKTQSNHGHFGENKHTDHGAILGDHKAAELGDATGHHEFSSFNKHFPSFMY